MKIITTKSEVIHQKVSSALCGLRLDHVSLNKDDFKSLRELTDVQLKQWVDNVSCRFPPSRRK